MTSDEAQTEVLFDAHSGSVDVGRFEVGGMLRTAQISDDGLYRYQLKRVWDDQKTSLPWIMLNPSTADALVDDPTIRRCIGFARDMGYGGIEVYNLYAFRATQPADLWKSADPVGPKNDGYLSLMLYRARRSGTPVVAAWVANARPDRIAELTDTDLLFALGVTKDGQPRHPLYLPKTAELTRWSA